MIRTLAMYRIGVSAIPKPLGLGGRPIQKDIEQSIQMLPVRRKHAIMRRTERRETPFTGSVTGRTVLPCPQSLPLGISPPQ